MKKQFLILAVAALAAACGDVPNQVYLEEPSNNALTGAWTGTEEITTDNDITSNTNFPGTTAGGFSFPVVIMFDGSNRFTLLTSNYPTSYLDDSERSCSGFYARSGSSISLYPNSQCRALPMYKFTIGRTLPDGISLEARTNTSGDPMANYASVHVIFHLTQS